MRRWIELIVAIVTTASLTIVVVDAIRVDSAREAVLESRVRQLEFHRTEDRDRCLENVEKVSESLRACGVGVVPHFICPS